MKQTGGFCAVSYSLKFKDTVKEAIIIALIELMKERDFNSITIIDIVKKAGVGRSSFYRNFSSKEDILLLYIAFLFDDTLAQPLKDEDIQGYIVSRFRVFRQHKDLFLVLKNSGMLHLLYQQAVNRIKSNIEFHGRYLNPYQAAFFSGAVVSVIVQWAENDFCEEEESLADMFIYLMDGHHREGTT